MPSPTKTKPVEDIDGFVSGFNRVSKRAAAKCRIINGAESFERRQVDRRREARFFAQTIAINRLKKRDAH